MPVICTKDQNSRYKALTTSRVSSKKHADNDSEQTLRTFSIKSPESSNTTFLAGAAIPNSTVKASLIKNNPALDIKSDSVENVSIVDKEDKEDTGDKKIKGVHNSVLEKIEEKDEKSSNENCLIEIEKPSPKSSSLISASEKIKELQELQKQLHKSYEPKPLFEPRRPTLDSIRSAIDKAKKEAEKNKKMEAKMEEDEKKYIVLRSDASTSTEKINKKARRKKKKEAEKAPSSVNASTSSPSSSANKTKNKKKKKINIAVKLKANVDRSSQP